VHADGARWGPAGFVRRLIYRHHATGKKTVPEIHEDVFGDTTDYEMTLPSLKALIRKFEDPRQAAWTTTYLYCRRSRKDIDVVPARALARKMLVQE
jgi:hypothetical protein